MKKLFSIFALLLLGSLAQAQQSAGVVFGTNLSVSSAYASPQGVKALPFPTYGSGEMIVVVSNLGAGANTCSFSPVFSGQAAASGQNSSLNFATSAGQSGAFITGNGILAYHVVISNNGSESGPFSSVGVTYSCVAYPSSGSAFVEFIPDTAPVLVYQHFTTNASNQVKVQSAFLHSIVINQAGTSETISIFDNTACSGNAVAITTGFTTGQVLTYDVATSKGLCILTAGTTPGDYTVSYR